MAARTRDELGPELRVSHLTKTFGAVRALDDLSFTVAPGRVTGFLGPNGAGKTTTLRVLLGLVRPDTGTATVGGSTYRDLPDPPATVGAALEASGFHPGRTARGHLSVQAAALGLPTERVAQALAQVGMTEAADRRIGGYSLGMRQRLGLAAALLADPPVLLLDEPGNGLDPEGVAWLRGFLRHLADRGRTVVISSHVLSEVQQTVDDVVIISRGRLVTQRPLAELVRGRRTVLVETPDPTRLISALAAEGLPSRLTGEHAVEVTGAEPARVGHLAFTAGVELHRLTGAEEDLEATFLELTR